MFGKPGRPTQPLSSGFEPAPVTQWLAEAAQEAGGEDPLRRAVSPSKHAAILCAVALALKTHPRPTILEAGLFASEAWTQERAGLIGEAIGIGPTGWTGKRLAELKRELRMWQRLVLAVRLKR